MVNNTCTCGSESFLSEVNILDSIFYICDIAEAVITTLSGNGWEKYDRNQAHSNFVFGMSISSVLASCKFN